LAFVIDGGLERDRDDRSFTSDMPCAALLEPQ
jgi:hypothetical protein